MTDDAFEFHLYVPQLRVTMPSLVERAQAAEAAGFTGLALMDHLAPPAAEDQPMLEAMTAATWVAAHTERLIVGHLVLCDAFRHPSVLARQAVTLDHASSGRFELGLGSGSVPAELARYGLGAPSGTDRVARLAETLDVLRGLWSGEPFDYQGRFFSLNSARQLPAPLGRIPLLLGGTGPRTMALVARHADWWNVPIHQLDRVDAVRPQAGAAKLTVQELVTFIPDENRRQEISDLASRRYGRMAGQGGGVTGSGDELVAHYRALRDRGVARVYTWFTDFAPPATLAAFGEQVIARL
jgi:alkanesulfonate monooxygenase SsuD/methylene tetrahydromethanopterin reductase-like flavin-dependent oxidoreductase (luciferase family)